MRKTLPLVLAIGLSLGTALTFTTRAKANPACECSCAWVCDNRCQFTCTGCGLTEEVTKSEECCQGAYYGDTGACGEGGPQS